MKQLSLILLAFLPLAVAAQEKKSMQWGIQVGSEINPFHQYSPDAIIKMSASLGAQFRMPLKNHWYLYSGITLLNRISRERIPFNTLIALEGLAPDAPSYMQLINGESFNDNARLIYTQRIIEIPALISYSMGKRLFIKGGLRAGWLFQAQTRFTDTWADGSKVNWKQSTSKGIYNPLQATAQLGVGWQIPTSGCIWTIEPQVNLSLFSYTRVNNQRPFNAGINLGYYFGKR